MSVSNGQPANQTTFNTAFVSKTAANQEMAGSLAVNDDTQSTTDETGALKTAGGLGVKKNANIGGDQNVAGNQRVELDSEVGGDLDVEGSAFVDGDVEVDGVAVMGEQSSTPAAPAAGYYKVYPKADGALYIQDDGGVETEVGAVPSFDSLAPATTKGDLIAHDGTNNVRLPVGSPGQVLKADPAADTGLVWGAGGGSGGGGINYESDPYFQLGEGDWALHGDTTDLDGGTTTGVTFTTDANETQIFSGDFKGVGILSKDAADRDGVGVVKTYTIPAASQQQGQVYVSGWYSSTTGLSTGDIVIAAYDVTNSTLLDIYGIENGELGELSIDGVGRFTGRIAIRSNTASIRLGFYWNDGTSDAKDFYFSDLQLGPDKLLDTDFDHVEYAANTDVTDADDTTDFTNTPSGATFPSSAWTTSRAKRVQFKEAILPGDNIGLEYSTDGGDTWFEWTSGARANTASIVPFTGGSNDSAGFGVIIPVDSTHVDVLIGRYRYATSAWNADTGTARWRVVKRSKRSAKMSTTELMNQAAVAYLSRTNTISLAEATPTKLPFNSSSIETDPLSLYNATDDRFEIRENGFYRFTGRVAHAAASNRNFGVEIWINGVSEWSDLRPGTITNTSFLTTTTPYIYLTAGSYAELYGYQNDTSGSSSNNVTQYQFSIERKHDLTVYGTYSDNSDAEATRNGRKQYLHGTTYNGGAAPTVTAISGTYTVARAVFIPYQMQDGGWRLKFNVSGALGAAAASVTLSINGVTFKNISNYSQAVAARVGTRTTGATAVPNTSTIDGFADSTGTNWGFSGDVELESKPTWAY